MVRKTGAENPRQKMDSIYGAGFWSVTLSLILHLTDNRPRSKIHCDIKAVLSVALLVHSRNKASGISQTKYLPGESVLKELNTKRELGPLHNWIRMPRGNLVNGQDWSMLLSMPFFFSFFYNRRFCWTSLGFTTSATKESDAFKHWPSISLCRQYTRAAAATVRISDTVRRGNRGYYSLWM